MDRSDVSARFDVVVVGAGFGGLGAALALAERGARVCLLEQLDYPGGCASTFRRRGHRFESGATLFSGFAEGQLFRRWIDRYGLPVTIDLLDPLVELRAPGFELAVPRDRARLIDRIVELPGAPAEATRRFFAYQRSVADALWGLLDDPALLPPFDLAALGRHVRRLPRYAGLLTAVGRSLGSVLTRFGLQGFEPLRVYLDALCQITVQCSSAEAEAPFALATMDYYFRGTGHVRGGIGVLAQALVDAIRRAGGDVRLAHRVRRLERVPGLWRASSRWGTVEAPNLVANLVPQALARLVGAAPGVVPALDARARAVETGWGATMLYLVVDEPAGADPHPRHLELVDDPTEPFTEGRHVFCSISGAEEEGRAGPGERTVTVSTHVPLAGLGAMTDAERATYVGAVQDRMRRTLARRAPEWWSRVKLEMTASPRTFERFTGRTAGYVGGVPRRVGLHHYLDLVPGPVLPGLHLVGDSVFPGQSTLATAVGGLKLAERLTAGR